MDQVSDEDKELKAILEMNLDSLDTLGIEDSSFREAAPVAPVTLEMRMGASPRLARLQAQWDKGEPGDNPSGLPMSRTMDQAQVTDRTLTYKATLLKTYDAGILQTREMFDLICLGETASMGPTRFLVGS